ncbi:hypothetical protein I7I50_11710 [Histoplasma capsulatum G186AR]|uniref:Uncharacterized protein n=1 Tax=Ajellomyces capsulatus TaxID=5037 RepID=A0A8H7Z884_AJECA|nr:hypothetical protein I7I52_02948 [Histoplasma capsulatum]QSS70164.1 hypothetical protein I7I50_11710 [Histoplasma capsulatum G186AR]
MNPAFLSYFRLDPIILAFLLTFLPSLIANRGYDVNHRPFVHTGTLSLSFLFNFAPIWLYRRNVEWIIPSLFLVLVPRCIYIHTYIYIYVSGAVEQWSSGAVEIARAREKEPGRWRRCRAVLAHQPVVQKIPSKPQDSKYAVESRGGGRKDKKERGRAL